MRTPRLADALLLTAMVAGGVALGLVTGTAIDAVFLAVVAAALFTAGAIATRSLRSARQAARVARAAVASSDDELVAQSVAAEGARLTQDIEARLRACLAEVAAVADDRGSDPPSAARRIHRVSREATAELRRQLGLLREEATDASPTPPSAVGDWGPRLRRADVIVGAITIALALAEAVVYPVMAGAGVTWPTLLATVLAAATVLWWRAAPGPAALGCGAVWLGAALVGTPVQGGFWVIAVLGLLAFQLASRGAAWIDLAGGVALLGGVVTASVLADPENAGANTVGLAVAAITGGIVRLARARSRAAHRTAERRTEEVGPVVRAAVAQRRATLARELHDTVSHAVGVIAVQAAAAEVSWPQHPERTLAALAACGETAQTALAELGALTVGEPAPASPDGLVERFRAAGLEVRWDAASARFVPADLEPLVGRIVQESLTNVLRHSGGRAARVEIEPVGSALRVVVDDEGDGAGRATSTAPGFGLVGLRERVELAGGRFEAGPKDGGGFRVLASLPTGVTAA